MNSNLNKAGKNKYVKPQIFSISGAVRPNNPAHCRSMADLNNLQLPSAEKQNLTTDHFSSITSNQQNRFGQKIAGPNTNSNNNQAIRQPLGNNNNSANISNIAKILLNPNSTKTKNQVQGKNANVSQNNSLSMSVSKKNQPVKQFRKNNLIFDSNLSNRVAKAQARVSSQTNLKQSDSLSRNNTQSIHQICSLQKQKSQKSLKKANYEQKAVRKNRQKQEEKAKYDYCLLKKLKQYIEQLKQNEGKYLQQIQQLSQQNNKLRQQIVLLNDKSQVLHIRQKQMMKKIKIQEQQISRLNSQHHQRQNNCFQSAKTGANNECSEHMLIIQSLKNVISEQMSKLIEMETYKIQLQQRDSRENKNNKNANHASRMHEKLRIKGEWENHQQKYQNLAESQLIQSIRNEHPEVYSFKKRQNLNQSSIYLEEDSIYQEGDSNQNSIKKLEMGTILSGQMKNDQRITQTAIPQPYNQLIKCLKSDSRENNSSNNSNKESKAQPKSQGQSSSHCSRSRGQDYCESSQRKSTNYKYSGNGVCSQDQILKQVGQYLQGIRKNIHINNAK